MGKKLQQSRHFKKLKKHSAQINEEVKRLEAELAAGAPAPGTNPLALDAQAPGSYAGARLFDELPLSTATKDGLKAGGFINMTAIQRAGLPHALAGRDVLGAAKTGSGKTLAFLIPVSIWSSCGAMRSFRYVQPSNCMDGVHGCAVYIIAAMAGNCSLLVTNCVVICVLYASCKPCGSIALPTAVLPAGPGAPVPVALEPAGRTGWAGAHAHARAGGSGSLLDDATWFQCSRGT